MVSSRSLNLSNDRHLSGPTTHGLSGEFPVAEESAVSGSLLQVTGLMAVGQL